MTVLDDHFDHQTDHHIDAAADPLGATTSELSDELIFLIASASTGDQRKRATELFRYFSRQLAEEAYRRGKDSAAVRQLPPAATPLALEAPAVPQAGPASNMTQDPMLPEVRWLG
jgi:hypothetical protein